MPSPFAVAQDVKDRWPSFPTGQEAYALVLCNDASAMVRERWPNVDSRITSGALLAESLERVVCTMVKTAMLNGDSEGLESSTVTTGPFGDTRQFTNPNGSLYFTAEMIRLLDGYGWKPRALVDWMV